MRIRPVWIAVPACAAAGVVTYSFVAAQEPAAPAGFYQTKVTPHPSVVAEQNRSYVRPLNEPEQPGKVSAHPPTNWTAPGATTPARLAGTPTTPGHAPLPRPRYTQPAVSGPNVTPADGPIQQVSATAPVTPPPAGQPKKYFPDAAPGRSPEPLVIPPPDLSPVVPSIAAPLPATPAPVLPPPRVTLETAPPEPAKGVEPPRTAELPKPIEPAKTAEAAKPAEFPKPSDPRPLPTIGAAPSGPSAPATPPAAPAVTAAPPAPAPLGSGFPAGPLPARQAPNVVVEAVAPESVGVGQPLTYELVIRNAGVSPVANVRVEDELPAGAKFVSSDPAGEQSGTRLGWTVGALDAGAEKRIKVTVKPADEGELRSRAVVSFATAAEARVRVTRPRVSVALSAADAVRVGDEVPFQIKVANTGSGPAGKLVIQAKLSDGLHHPQGAVIEAELTNLAPGESKTVTLRALATKAGPQACTITAAADGNAAESAKSALSVVEAVLQTKLAGPPKCLVRSEPTFTLEMANPGTAGTDPVQAWAVIPDGFEFLSATDGGAFTPANRTVMWKLAGLPAGTSKMVSFKLRATAPAEGTVKTVAQAVPPAPEPTGVQPAGHRPAAATVRVLEAKADAPVKAEGVPALRFEVADVEDPVEVGKEAVYEVRVVNQGTGPCTNVQIVATLADGTQVTGASGQTAGRGQGQQVAFDPIPTLDTKKEAVYQIRVKGTQPGDHRFKVQVTCDQIKTPIVKEENTRFFKE